MQIADQVVVSTDGHVNELPEMWKRMPAKYADLIPRFEKRVDGTNFLTLPKGSKIRFETFRVPPEAEDYEREFRRDPTGGTDLARRIAHIGRDGVHAEVVFPNLLLAAGVTDHPAFNETLARTYNDWVFEVFAPCPERFMPAAIIPLDDIKAGMAEAERCLKKGFRTVFMPASIPWRPYYSDQYDPLWSLFEDAAIPVNFHVFSGDTCFFSDFASFTNISVEKFARVKPLEPADSSLERLSTTVIGMAAGMGPIVHLTGGGALERHPRFKFVIVEAECGWLAWTLQAMDSMQHKRRLHLERLSIKASEYFLRQGAVTFTDDPVGLNNIPFTGSHCLMWSNDYPHDEGTFLRPEAGPEMIRARLSDDNARALLCGNAARIYGFDLAKIAAMAATTNGTAVTASP